ncbi:endothelial lipase-like, partial [Penaeus japonicus]|uniref:endothelial lipase-like n=1 Tax=Penaeus japonicus TaxID=27405 RepID=UPI001C7143E3
PCSTALSISQVARWLSLSPRGNKVHRPSKQCSLAVDYVPYEEGERGGSRELTMEGWNIRGKAPFRSLSTQNMKEEYLAYDDLNVVVVDWLSGSGPPYTQAVANIRLIGAIIGRLVLDLEEYFGVPPSAVHVVGHSLGAQLGGYAGEYLKSQGAKLGRITAPFRSLSTQNMKEEYLAYDDLNVVVVDWLSGSGPPYTQAVANIRLIGAIIGRLVLDLEEYFGVPPSAVHVVGHSLGAQLGGYAGEYLKSQGAKLGRIT